MYVTEKKNVISSMAIAGALAGLGGGLLYLAGSGNGIQVVDTLAAEDLTEFRLRFWL